MSFTLLPAVDVADGQAVRLVQGRAGTETMYGSPLDAALAWQRDGAEWIHLVDLDAAFGRGENRSVIKRVIRAAKHVNVELSGGIRDDESLERAFDAGARRINLGTAALEQPAFARRLAGRFPVAVGLDARGREVAVRGWETGSGRDLLDVAREFADAGVQALIVTEIGRDGTLTGLMLAARVVSTGRSLAELATVMERLPQVLVNVRDVDRSRVGSSTELSAAVAEAEAELGTTGRVLLRPSGTEPVVRVMVEAADIDHARSVAGRLADVVKSALG